MCVWCEKYADGYQRWYFNPANYARKLYKIRKEEAEAAGAEGGPLTAGGMALLTDELLQAWDKKDYATIDRIKQDVERVSWAAHFGQVVTLEDTLKVIDLIYPIAIMTCLCRRSMLGLPDEENFTCIGMGAGMYKWERWPNNYRGGVQFLDDQALQAAGLIQRSGTPAMWWMGAPMKIDDQPVGVIAVQSYRHDVGYTPRDLELLGFVATHIATAIGRRRAALALRTAYLELERRVAERTRELALANESLRQQISAREGMERQLKHQALHDSLTGLPNRQYLLDRLVAAMSQHAAQPERLFAVLFLDLDRFKVINDSEGHLVGDALLREAARRIGECVRSPDTLARLGGDEFAVLLERIRSIEDVIHVAERIMQVLDRPFLVEGRELHSSASVGIAMVQPHYHSAEEILRDADAAMYRAKADGRKRFALFDENLRQVAQQRLELERELRRGLAEARFIPYYQPIVSLGNGAVLGYETLLRWRRGDGEVLAPGAFLGLAEETGLIEEIDWRMYACALHDLARIVPRHAYVTVNLSPRHLLAPDFAGRFLELVEAQRALPSRVCVEVTEGALIDRKDVARAALETLHRAGVRIVLDDFGTGYSALSYLQHFPLHGLKIDRSFASMLEGGGAGRSGSRPIIRAIVAMANSLDLEVVGEGIETEEQRQALWTLGVRQGQGYHFGRPAPLEHWLAQSTVDAS